VVDDGQTTDGPSLLYGLSVSYRPGTSRMVEYRADDSKHLFERAGELYPEFGGLLSFFMKPCEKLLILFGQDEAIFKQHLLTLQRPGRYYKIWNTHCYQMMRDRESCCMSSNLENLDLDSRN
jgi:hypothetical protein